MARGTGQQNGITQREILKIYWPLAASWLLMGLEGPAVSAVIARLLNPKINLAAYGGIVYPFSLIIEAPIIMLLAASTALCKDWPTYKKLMRFMMASGAILTAIHAVIAFTPLFYFIADNIMGVPKEIQSTAKLGLMLMTPWTWSIAYRRFQQGVMIRFEKSSAVGIGTLIRLAAVGSVLGAGLAIHLDGIVIGALAHSIGVISEAIYSGIAVRPILNEKLKLAPTGQLIGWKKFIEFYTPLALTSFLSYFWQPIGSAAISRMNMPLESLAVWPVVSGFLFFLRTFGLAYNEAVVSVLDRNHSYNNLQKFTQKLVVGTTLTHLLLGFTPLAMAWFSTISALPNDLAQMAVAGFWLGLPMPALAVLQSWYQGSLVYGRDTRGIPESVVIYFITVFIVLLSGMKINQYSGVAVVMLGASMANATQTAWLWVRSKNILLSVKKRDLPEAV